MGNIEPRSWAWSPRHNQQVQVLEVENLWGEKIAVVKTFENEVLRLPVHLLRPSAENAISRKNPNLFCRIAAAARLKEHLNRPDTLVAPLNPTLMPLPHQLIHLENALKKPQLRLLVADEVGLGKTITACLIMQELRARGEIQKVLILTPSGLVSQWASELKDHFKINPVVVDRRSIQVSGRDIWRNGDTVLAGYDSVKPLERRNWTEEKNAEYNHNRFDAIIEKDWDLVVIDEAHRVAGATEGVARNKLARSLAASFPRLLLLTGTPHHGNPKQFLRLMELLDSKNFHSNESVSKDQVSPFILRMEKRNATDLDGRPLFVERQTKVVPTKRSDLTDAFSSLMDNATSYIRNYYNLAETELVERNPELYKMLLVLIQRRLASSTVALESSLRRRLDYLTSGNKDPDPDEGRDEEDAHPPSDMLFVPSRPDGNSVQEIKEIENLLGQVENAKKAAPDPKFRTLRSLIRDIRIDEGPETKLIIFTEFIDTQNMLTQHLTKDGEEVSRINGTMNLDERMASIHHFRDQGTVLVTTEAGGEGLNLQFCHVLINYDLPWNPMRIEQRIGRVHRIGQTRPVRAFNLVLEGTIEHRVIERLGEKLASILEQAGLDKLTDVLDVSDLNSEFEQLEAKASALAKDSLDREVEDLLDDIKERINEILEERPIESEEIDIASVRARLDVPTEIWARNALDDPQAKGLDLSDEMLRSRIDRVPIFTPAEPVPIVATSLAHIQGFWALWRIKITDGTGSSRQVFVPVLKGPDGESRNSVAVHVWEQMAGDPPEIIGLTTQEESRNLHEEVARFSKENLREVYERVQSHYRQESNSRLQRTLSSIEIRREAVERHGLEEVRKFRRKRLEEEEHEAKRQHELMTEFIPELNLVLIAELVNHKESE